MDERARAIVLRTRLQSETSLIVQWLTEDQGRLSTIARGALRPKSPFKGKLDLLHECEILARRSRSSTLHTLSEVKFLGSWPSLRSDMLRLRQACCAIRWIEMQTEVDTPIPGLFNLFQSLLTCLEESGKPTIPLLAFELRFVNLLGQFPDLDESSLSMESRQILTELADRPWSEIPSLQPGPAALKALLFFLHGFLIYHLGKLPQGRNEALNPGF